MQRPEQLLSALIAEAASFWEGRSADPRPFNTIMQGHEPLVTLAKASGYHPHEITVRIPAKLDSHSTPNWTVIP